jgi:hypothetical protein
VIGKLVASWAGQHGAEALDKGEGMQAHAVNAVAKASLEAKEDVAVCHNAQTALGDGRPGDIAGEAFAGRGRAGSDGRAGVEGEAVQAHAVVFAVDLEVRGLGFAEQAVEEVS